MKRKSSNLANGAAAAEASFGGRKNRHAQQLNAAVRQLNGEAVAAPRNRSVVVSMHTAEQRAKRPRHSRQSLSSHSTSENAGAEAAAESESASSEASSSSANPPPYRSPQRTRANTGFISPQSAIVRKTGRTVPSFLEAARAGGAQGAGVFSRLESVGQAVSQQDALRGLFSRLELTACGGINPFGGAHVPESPSDVLGNDSALQATLASDSQLAQLVLRHAEVESTGKVAVDLTAWSQLERCVKSERTEIPRSRVAAAISTSSGGAEREPSLFSKRSVDFHATPRRRVRRAATRLHAFITGATPDNAAEAAAAASSSSSAMDGVPAPRLHSFLRSTSAGVLRNAATWTSASGLPLRVCAILDRLRRGYWALVDPSRLEVAAVPPSSAAAAGIVESASGVTLDRRVTADESSSSNSTAPASNEWITHPALDPLRFLTNEIPAAIAMLAVIELPTADNADSSSRLSPPTSSSSFFAAHDSGFAAAAAATAMSSSSSARVDRYNNSVIESSSGRQQFLSPGRSRLRGHSEVVEISVDGSAPLPAPAAPLSVFRSVNFAPTLTDATADSMPISRTHDLRSSVPSASASLSSFSSFEPPQEAEAVASSSAAHGGGESRTPVGLRRRLTTGVIPPPTAPRDTNGNVDSLLSGAKSGQPIRPLAATPPLFALPCAAPTADTAGAILSFLNRAAELQLQGGSVVVWWPHIPSTFLRSVTAGSSSSSSASSADVVGFSTSAATSSIVTSSSSISSAVPAAPPPSLLLGINAATALVRSFLIEVLLVHPTLITDVPWRRPPTVTSVSSSTSSSAAAAAARLSSAPPVTIAHESVLASALPAPAATASATVVSGGTQATKALLARKRKRGSLPSFVLKGRGTARGTSSSDNSSSSSSGDAAMNGSTLNGAYAACSSSSSGADAPSSSNNSSNGWNGSSSSSSSGPILSDGLGQFSLEVDEQTRSALNEERTLAGVDPALSTRTIASARSSIAAAAAPAGVTLSGRSVKLQLHNHAAPGIVTAASSAPVFAPPALLPHVKVRARTLQILLRLYLGATIQKTTTAASAPSSTSASISSAAAAAPVPNDGASGDAAEVSEPDLQALKSLVTDLQLLLDTFKSSAVNGLAFMATRPSNQSTIDAWLDKIVYDSFKRKLPRTVAFMYRCCGLSPPKSLASIVMSASEATVLETEIISPPPKVNRRLNGREAGGVPQPLFDASDTLQLQSSRRPLFENPQRRPVEFGSFDQLQLSQQYQQQQCDESELDTAVDSMLLRERIGSQALCITGAPSSSDTSSSRVFSSLQGLGTSPADTGVTAASHLPSVDDADDPFVAASPVRSTFRQPTGLHQHAAASSASPARTRVSMALHTASASPAHTSSSRRRKQRSAAPLGIETDAAAAALQGQDAGIIDRVTFPSSVHSRDSAVSTAEQSSAAASGSTQRGNDPGGGISFPAHIDPVIESSSLSSVTGVGRDALLQTVAAPDAAVPASVAPVVTISEAAASDAPSIPVRRPAGRPKFGLANRAFANIPPSSSAFSISSEFQTTQSLSGFDAAKAAAATRPESSFFARDGSQYSAAPFLTASTEGRDDMQTRHAAGDHQGAATSAAAASDASVSRTSNSSASASTSAPPFHALTQLQGASAVTSTTAAVSLTAKSLSISSTAKPSKTISTAKSSSIASTATAVPAKKAPSSSDRDSSKQKPKQASSSTASLLPRAGQQPRSADAPLVLPVHMAAALSRNSALTHSTNGTHDASSSSDAARGGRGKRDALGALMQHSTAAASVSTLDVFRRSKPAPLPSTSTAATSSYSSESSSLPSSQKSLQSFAPVSSSASSQCEESSAPHSVGSGERRIGGTAAHMSSCSRGPTSGTAAAAASAPAAAASSSSNRNGGGERASSTASSRRGDELDLHRADFVRRANDKSAPSFRQITDLKRHLRATIVETPIRKDMLPRTTTPRT